ncbi:hypothetical protein M427DRAFT_158103 [Gonapodya prolifera JEL478]|uniref:L domain-like protein n=1 Tax=Gonapodya prolifera (strain JEL478) TaxID=1344416 RepID=A0A139A3Y9_GONPJ|nr:hypothetical protein M427DRAFT_158103 [Gonapodya prolifera JEL478]|eukprot:KXS11522.1 hypothetical protein M427DRAFT_158103 [Gonapodya prolifera JEL478]
MRHLFLFPALLSTLALVPLTLAQSQATDCAPFELLYERQGLALPWTKSQCCSKTTGTTAYFACTPEGRVTLAYFCCQHFTGSIPSLAGLTFLQTLVLSTNSLTGPIPDLSSLTSLTDLELASNDLSGNIDGLLPPNLSRCWITLFSRNQGLYSCASRFPQSCFSHDQLYRTDPACAALGAGASGGASAAGASSAAATSSMPGVVSSPTPSTTATPTDGSQLSAHTIGEPLATATTAPSPSPSPPAPPSGDPPSSSSSTPTPDSVPGSINNVSGPVAAPAGQMSLTIPIVIGVVAAALVAVGVVMVVVGRRARARGRGGAGTSGGVGLGKSGGAPAWLNLDAHHHASMQEQDTKPHPSSIPTTNRSRSVSPSHLALPYSSTAPASQPYSASNGYSYAYAYTSPSDPSSLPTQPPPSANPDAYAVSPATVAAWTPPPTYPAPSPPAQGWSGLKSQFSGTKGRQAQGQAQGQRSPEYTVPVASSPEHEPAGGYETGYAHQQRYISTATSSARANDEYGMMLDMAAMMDSISNSTSSGGRHSGGSVSPDGMRYGGLGYGAYGSAGLTHAHTQAQGQAKRGSQTSSELGLPWHRLEGTAATIESHRRPPKPSRSPESGGDGGAGGEFSQRRVTWAEQLEVQEIFAVLSETTSVRGPVSPWAG